MTYTIGGPISGLTGSNLMLTLIDNSGTTNAQTSKTISVAQNSLVYTFTPGIPFNMMAADSYSVFVSAQPTGPAQTCIPTLAFGYIYQAANVNNVQITCIDNTPSTLQGIYQVTSGANPGQSVWLAFAPDGTYIFADIETGTNPCNGIDYGAYNWNSSTGALTILSAQVYQPLAPCGFTNATGMIDPTSTFTLTRSGTGAATVLSIVVHNSSGMKTVTATPVASTNGSIVGGFVFGSGLDQGVQLFDNTGHYLIMFNQSSPNSSSGGTNGVEYGCYTTSGGMLNIDTTASCAGAVLGIGGNGFTSGAAAKTSLMYSTPDANTLTETVGGYSATFTRYVPN